MATGKVVVICRGLDQESWDVFKAEKPAGWEFTVVNPNDGEAAVIKECADAEYIMTVMSGPVSMRVIDASKKLKLIQTHTQGTDHLPMKLALEKGIMVANSGGANAISVAEHVLLLMLACERRLLQFNQAIREGKWRGTLDRKGSHELFDRTVGVVGFGNIGRRVAALCYGFGANIIYYERMFVPYALRADFKAKPVSLDELLSASDIVTLHLPSMASTRKMFGWNQFTKMKPTAYIINTGRGDVIDEDALTRALNDKKIAGAGLDVFDPEPPDPKNPLLHMPNVVATPHCAAAVVWENWRPTCETMWINIERVSEGKEPISRIREF